MICSELDGQPDTGPQKGGCCQQEQDQEPDEGHAPIKSELSRQQQCIGAQPGKQHHKCLECCKLKVHFI